MKTTTNYLIVVLLLFVSGSTWAVGVPLPSCSNMTVQAYGAFSEIFLEVLDGGNPLGLPVGLYNDLAIGLTMDTGSGSPGYVIYRGASSSPTAPPSSPNQILGVHGIDINIVDILQGTGDFAGITRARLYVGGIINSISTNDPGSTDVVHYNVGGGDTNPNPQLTFAIYNAHLKTLSLNLGMGNQIVGEWALDGLNPAHLDIWADATPDADFGLPSGGNRYLSTVNSLSGSGPELPIRDTVDSDGDGRKDLFVNLNTGTYSDTNGAAGTDWKGIDFAGGAGDDDSVMWSFVGNPNSIFKIAQNFVLSGGETFTAGWDSDGNDETPPTEIIVLASANSRIMDPLINGCLLGQFIPGTSLATGLPGEYNHLLIGEDPYILTGDFSLGGATTGAHDSDPYTFSGQQGILGGVGNLSQLHGEIPEPATLTLLGVAIVGVLRRRRRR